MSIPQFVIDNIAPSVQPLVFETGLPEFPYSTSGTVFLVEYYGKPFVLTTRHSLYPEKIGPICIFPSDRSSTLLPLKDVFFVPKEYEDEDFMDLAVIAIDTEKLQDLKLPPMTCIKLSHELNEWPAHLECTEFFLMGYPNEKISVEDDGHTICDERITLHATYIGPSLDFVHELEISDTYSLSEFSGFSGSPVFGCVTGPNEKQNIVFCGMVLRGGVQSRRIHFLDRSVLLDALKVKQALPQNQKNIV